MDDDQDRTKQRSQTLSDDDIRTHYHLPRRSLLRVAGASFVGASGVVAGTSGAPADSDDED